MTPTTDRPTLIAQIAALPEQLAAATADLSAKELTTPYLAGEWTVAQNVHHLADSHLNAYVRCKLIATEEQPVFKPYDQDAWALFPDAQRADLTVSLALLGSLHVRWVDFWQALAPDAWNRVGHHPERGPITLDDQLRLYAAHGQAHLDQIARTLAAATNGDS
jgi:uncharacterized damage-inducible protein DinB